QEFENYRQGAEFFHVEPVTVKRWLNGCVALNPMTEKLLIIKAIGYLPNDIRWQGFRINEELGIFITPDGREFSPKELASFAYQRDEYQLLLQLHGHPDPKDVPNYPAKPDVSSDIRGNGFSLLSNFSSNFFR
ncbi:phage protein, partial [Vibrio sp. Of7-15]|uniref:phage protein n=1 Tax=Vibrio sp. Of7-15 TaxID=2724879 RepID=UPI001EF236E7